MCLKIFVEGDQAMYEKFKPAAMKLGAAFQKVNFLRDAKEDFEDLGRTYFPGVNLANFGQTEKELIELEIESDFKLALSGIRKLPAGARRGVYLAYLYYIKLFYKIKRVEPSQVMSQRIRIPNGRKMGIMFNSLVRHSFNVL